MVENAFIPLADGVRLAVQLWLPDEAGTGPCPVVLEYIPYRKRDSYRAYGSWWGHVLASRGIAYARLETRGSGDSAGILEDEYLPSEQDDAVQAIAWLAAQAWCDGAVGMRGVSWGGFSALQAAALAPPALKAIMPMCASDRRFTDDAHFIGGAFALTGLKWATSFRLVAAGPPDPEISGEAWLAEWRARLAAVSPIAARWLGHDREDAYWRQGSLAVDYGAIRCPVYAVGGLADPYVNFIPRLLANLKVPARALLGPWMHGYPAPASPGPGLDWAFEEIRWWSEHLLGEATGIMDEPALRVFMPDATAAEAAPGPIPGRWIAEPAWPAPRVAMRRFHPAAGALAEAPGPPAEAILHSGDLVGLGKAEWVPFAPTELPAEQSADDGRSVVFDSAPLAGPLEVLGTPILRVRLSADGTGAHLAARLCQVGPDGRSWLVAWGLLDLTHRHGHDRPARLNPGEVFEVALPLHFTAHRFEAGARLRLALSHSLWPLVWPPAEPVRLSLDLAAAALDLPVRAAPQAEAPMPIPPAPPATSDPAAWPTLLIAEAEGEVRITETWPDRPWTVADTGETVSGAGPDIELVLRPDDPLSCRWRARQTRRLQRPGRDISLEVEVEVRAGAERFQVRESTVACLNGETIADIVQESEIRRGR